MAKITLNIHQHEYDNTKELSGRHALLTIHRVAIAAYRRGLRAYLQEPTRLDADLRKEARNA